MSALDKENLGIGRRGFLRYLAFFGVGVTAWGLRNTIDLPADKESKFIVVNGWVLPVKYFR